MKTLKEIGAKLSAVPKGFNVHRTVKRFLDNRHAHSEEKHASYLEELAQMNERVAEGRLEDAVIHAVDAHSLASDKHVMLQRADVSKLVLSTLQDAQEAEQQQDWVEAAALYRALDLLYEDTSTYREDLKRVGQHLRVLSLYTPQILHDLYVSRAQRLGEEEPEPMQDNGGWKKILAGIQLPMLRQTI